jgi:hypothetical protein
MIGSDGDLFVASGTFVAIYIGSSVRASGVTLRNRSDLRSQQDSLKSARRAMIGVVVVGLLGAGATAPGFVAILAGIHVGAIDVIRLAIVIVEALWVGPIVIAACRLRRIRKEIAAVTGTQLGDG